MREKLALVSNEIKQVIKGKDEVVDKVLATILAGGHILLEDIPGVGKTTLAVAVARAFSMDYRRMQFTPDVLPSDLLGFSLYNRKTETFDYQPGAVMCQLFLADEINRTSPKTQSALLEVMEEKTATVEGVTRPLPTPFTVIATENPLGSSGTQKLPESQVDRFMTCLTMGYPSHQDAIEILKENALRPVDHVNAILTANDVEELQKEALQVHVSDTLYDYIVTLTEKTRATQYFSQGASPRGSIALLRMSKAMALLRGRDYVVPEDVQAVYYDVFGHRVTLNPKAKAANLTIQDVLKQIYDETEVPGA